MTSLNAARHCAIDPHRPLHSCPPLWTKGFCLLHSSPTSPRLQGSHLPLPRTVRPPASNPCSMTHRVHICARTLKFLPCGVLDKGHPWRGSWALSHAFEGTRVVLWGKSGRGPGKAAQASVCRQQPGAGTWHGRFSMEKGGEVWRAGRPGGARAHQCVCVCMCVCLCVCDVVCDDRAGQVFFDDK